MSSRQAISSLRDGEVERGRLNTFATLFLEMGWSFFFVVEIETPMPGATLLRKKIEHLGSISATQIYNRRLACQPPPPPALPLLRPFCGSCMWAQTFFVVRSASVCVLLPSVLVFTRPHQEP